MVSLMCALSTEDGIPEDSNDCCITVCKRVLSTEDSNKCHSSSALLSYKV